MNGGGTVSMVDAAMVKSRMPALVRGQLQAWFNYDGDDDALVTVVVFARCKADSQVQVLPCFMICVLARENISVENCRSCCHGRWRLLQRQRGTRMELRWLLRYFSDFVALKMKLRIVR